MTTHRFAPSPPSASRLSRDLDEGRTTSEGLVDACLARIGSHDARLRAFIEVYADSAPLAARAHDMARAAGHRLGRFHGVPIALKDLIDIEGRITTAGSKAWSDRRATGTATLVRKLISAGMVILGKTHAVEFALGGWGTSETIPTPWNPWDGKTHRVPGGSSSGSAVAVAAGMAPWAIGTDTGGSIRMPAGFCGLTGFKPSFGRISLHGVVPLSRSMDTVGTITRSAEDSAHLYHLLQGFDPLDPRTAMQSCVDPLPALARGIAGLRIGRMPDEERAGVAPAVLDAYDRALETMASSGATVEPVALPCRFLDYAPENARIVSAEAYVEFGALANDPALPLDPVVRARILGGAATSAAQYLGAHDARSRSIGAFDTAFSGFDALITPTTESTAIPIDRIDPDNQPSRFTRIANFLDLCALSVPSGCDESGLPTSIQIVCRRYDEATALRIGAAYQSRTEWHLRAPILA